MKSLRLIVPLFLIFGFYSCKKEADEAPIPTPPPEEEIELSTDSRILVFNALKEKTDIDITINQSEFGFSLSRGDVSDYYLLDQGDAVFEVKESGTVLLTKILPLKGGYFYSAHFYTNKSGEYDLFLSQDYDETERIVRNGSNTVNFIALNLSQNIPFPTMNVFNRVANRSTPNGDIGGTRINKWIGNLSYGETQKTSDALFGNIANQLVFTSGEAGPTSIDDETLGIPISALSGSAIRAQDGFSIRTYQNTRNFLSNRTYIFIAYDHHTEEGKTDGVILDLNSVKIIE